MPSERFLKLDAKKRERILRAACDEFARVPFEEASINRIIKSADISRGSFYTYFADKRDVMRCVFQRERERTVETFQRLVEEQEGDIWKAAEAWYLCGVRIFATEEVQRTLSIIVKNKISFQIDEMCISTEPEQEEDALADWLLVHAAPSLGSLKGDPERVQAFCQLLVLTVMSTAAQVVTKKKSEAEGLAAVRMKLDILRCGISAER